MTNLQNYVLRKIIEQLDPEEQDALNALVQDLGADRPNVLSVRQDQEQADPIPFSVTPAGEVAKWAHDFRSDMAWFLDLGSKPLPEFKEFGKRMFIRCNALANRVKVLEAELTMTPMSVAPADWMEERAKLIAKMEASIASERKYEDLLEKCVELIGENQYERVYEKLVEFEAMRADRDEYQRQVAHLNDQLEAAANVGYENTATIERLQKELESAINVANLRERECEQLLADLQYARKELEAHKAGFETVSASSVPASNTVEPVFIEAKQVDTPIEVVTKKPTPEPPKKATPAPKANPNLSLPWNYATSPEVMIEYIRLRASAMPHAMAVIQSGVHVAEREKVRVNLQSVVTSAATRSGLERDMFLDEKLKEWKARRDKTNGK